jgi:biopolymer transport protein ExbD
MTFRDSFAVLSLVGLLAAASIGRAQGSDVRDSNPLFVEIQADGRTCKVGNVTIKCAHVLTHLRQVLKLPPGSWIRFKAARSAPYRDIKDVMDAVQKSEYTTSVAYLTEPKSEK